jgi:hypothetical protein
MIQECDFPRTSSLSLIDLSWSQTNWRLGASHSKSTKSNWKRSHLLLQYFQPIPALHQNPCPTPILCPVEWADPIRCSSVITLLAYRLLIINHTYAQRANDKSSHGKSFPSKTLNYNSPQRMHKCVSASKRHIVSLYTP